jgi:hypothetical protein
VIQNQIKNQIKNPTGLFQLIAYGRENPPYGRDIWCRSRYRVMEEYRNKLIHDKAPIELSNTLIKEMEYKVRDRKNICMIYDDCDKKDFNLDEILSKLR